MRVLLTCLTHILKSIYITDDYIDIPPHLIPNPSVDSLSSITIYECDVLATLKTIDITKACGVDNIPGRILRECAEQIAFPITILLNKSLKAGIFPSCLKRANVIPVFKLVSVMMYIIIGLYLCCHC